MKKRYIIIIFLILMLIFSQNSLAANGATINAPSTVETDSTVTINVTISNVAAWNITITASGATDGCIKRFADATEDALNTTKTFSISFKSKGTGSIDVVVNGDVTSQDGKNKNVSASKRIAVTTKQTETKPNTSTGSSSNQQQKPNTSTGSSSNQQQKPSTSTGSSSSQQQVPSTSTGSSSSQQQKPSTSTGSSSSQPQAPSTSTGSSSSQPQVPSTSTEDASKDQQKQSATTENTSNEQQKNENTIENSYEQQSTVEDMEESQNQIFDEERQEEIKEKLSDAEVVSKNVNTKYVIGFIIILIVIALVVVIVLKRKNFSKEKSE